MAMKAISLTRLAPLLAIAACATPRAKHERSHDGQLHKQISEADRIVVRDGGFDCCRSVEKDKVLFEVTDPAELAEVHRRLEFKRGQEGGSCLCCGYPGIDWYKGDTRLALTALQHGCALRWKGFADDAPLTRESSEWIVEWLASHGATLPKKRLEASRRKAAVAKRGREKLAPFVPPSYPEALKNAEAEIIRARDGGGEVSTAEEDGLRDKHIRSAFTNEAEMYSSLFRVLGCLPMHWDCRYFPEQMRARDFMVRAPRNELNGAIRRAARSEDPLERRGAARLVYAQHFMRPHGKTKSDIRQWMALHAGEAYSDPFPENRRLVLSRLVKYPGTGATGVLRMAVEDPDRTVRRKAIAALGVRDTDQARAILGRVAEGATRPRRQGVVPENLGEGAARSSTPGMRAEEYSDTDRQAASRALARTQ